MEFPERIYTEEEHKKAKSLVDAGYKHNLNIKGDSDFVAKANKALELVRIAGCLDFLRTYLRQIAEVDGLSQLREAEATLWANKFAVQNPVDFASFIVQKAHHMKEYLDGELYYGGASEKRTVQKRMDFLQVLKEKSSDESVKAECERLLEMWRESALAY